MLQETGSTSEHGSGLDSPATVAPAGSWRRRILFVTLAVLVIATFYRLPRRSSGPPSRDGISWRSDLAAALSESRQLGKPVLVDFSASWCPPCQTMKRDAWPDAQVAQLADRDFIPVLLDIDQAQGQDAGRRYGIEFIPSILVLDSEGRVLRQAGFMSRDELVEFLRAAAKPG